MGMRGFTQLCIAALAALGLGLYCLGHGLLTDGRLHPHATLAWASAHAAGALAVLRTACATGPRAALAHWALTALAGAATAQVLYAFLHWIKGGAGDWLFNYPSTAVLLLGAGAAVLCLRAPPAMTPLLISIGQHKRRVDVRQIQSVHAARNYLELHLRGESQTALLRMTLQQLLRDHPNALLQVHRSHAVHPHAVQHLEQRRGRWWVRLHGGEQVPVSRSHWPSLQQRLSSVPRTRHSSHTT